MSDELPFGIEGYSLTGANDADRDYVLGCIKASILLSVSGREKLLSDFWIDDILRVTERSIREKLMGDEIFVLRKNGERIGMLWMGISRDQFTCDDVGYLLGIFVNEDARGKGLGSELMKSAETWCRNNDLLSLALNVGACNDVAIDLYRSNGFRSQTVVMKKDII